MWLDMVATARQMYKVYTPVCINKNWIDMTERATIPVSMPVELVKKVDNARAKLGYRSRNEVIRESVRHFLEEIEEMKVIRIRNISLKQAKKEILAYLKQRNSAYVSNIADTLGIDIQLAFKAAEELEREGVAG